MIAIPKKVADRLGKEVARFQPVLKGAKDRDVNESDTVTIIADMLATVFGFDKYTEITSEQAIRGTYCDLAVKLDGKVKYLVEVKAIGLDLKENHLRQAVNYGVNEGIQWVVLTNGVDWQVYSLKFERPVSWDLVTSFNILELNPRHGEEQDKLFLLCREGLGKAAIEVYHERIQSVNRFVIGAIIRTDAVLEVIRRELRRSAPGLKIATDEIAKIVSSDVLKREVAEGELADKAWAKVKKSTGKVLRKRNGKPSEVPADGQTVEPQEQVCAGAAEATEEQ